MARAEVQVYKPGEEVPTSGIYKVTHDPEFLAKARTGDGSTLDHWDVLFLMQHYRAPTRLLDWTEVMYVALYFAVSNQKPGKLPRLYIINPYAWNEKYTDSRKLFWPRYFAWDKKSQDYYEFGEILDEGGVDWQFPVALYPPQRDARLSSQRDFLRFMDMTPARSMRSRRA